MPDVRPHEHAHSGFEVDLPIADLRVAPALGDDKEIRDLALVEPAIVIGGLFLAQAEPCDALVLHGVQSHHGGAVAGQRRAACEPGNLGRIALPEVLQHLVADRGAGLGFVKAFHRLD